MTTFCFGAFIVNYSMSGMYSRSYHGSLVVDPKLHQSNERDPDPDPFPTRKYQDSDPHPCNTQVLNPRKKYILKIGID
jgi:hypothetical protein